MRISDWSSDVCSSDLIGDGPLAQLGMTMGARMIEATVKQPGVQLLVARKAQPRREEALAHEPDLVLDLSLLPAGRSEEHTSELQSLMRISYAVICLKKKKHTHTTAIYSLKTKTENQDNTN